MLMPELPSPKQKGNASRPERERKDSEGDSVNKEKAVGFLINDNNKKKS